jgi:hypothetical protein
VKWDEYDLYRSRVWMRLTRAEIEQRYPKEELRLTLLDELGLLEAHVRDLKRQLMNKQWAQMAHSASQAEHSARGVGFTINRILFPTLPVEMNVDVPDDTPKESER